MIGKTKHSDQLGREQIVCLCGIKKIKILLREKSANRALVSKFILIQIFYFRQMGFLCSSKIRHLP